MSGYTGRNRPAAGGGPSGVQRSYASQLKESEPLFNSYEHLQGLPRGDSALQMLRKIASLVKPIMRKRGWRVQVLAEFLPQEVSLKGESMTAVTDFVAGQPSRPKHQQGLQDLHSPAVS